MAVPLSPIPSEARPLAAVGWMTVTGLLFVLVTALVKMVGDGLPAAQSAFLRFVFGLVFVLPALRAMLAVRYTPRLVGMITARGIVHTFGVIGWFFAMTQLPLIEVTAMHYLTPIYVAIGAALFLGERMRARRIAAIGLALLGAMVILRPGFREIMPGHLAMLGSSLAMGASYLLAKYLTGMIGPGAIVALFSFSVTLGLAPFALFVWVTPTGEQMILLFLVAAAATAGHYTMTLALGAAPVSISQPVTFLQLVWASIIGLAVFGEPLDGFVLGGGAMIIGSVVFISLREAQLRRRAVTPPSVATKL